MGLAVGHIWLLGWSLDISELHQKALMVPTNLSVQTLRMQKIAFWGKYIHCAGSLAIFPFFQTIACYAHIFPSFSFAYYLPDNTVC